MAWSRCPVCAGEFLSDAVGDRHRVGDWDKGTRRCLTVDEMVAKGYHKDGRGRWRKDGGRDT